MSGRGLGHTGGTLDKLESILGFRIELGSDEFIRQVREIGLAIIGQTADLVPADKKLYALRDVTATVDIIPLIASSIMSKKIAGGADAIVLDVKVGDGAFMKTLDEARDPARTMVELGRMDDREVVCELTDMDQPLGRTVGNALEIDEPSTPSKGTARATSPELTLALRRTCWPCRISASTTTRTPAAEDAVRSGSARELYDRWSGRRAATPPAALPRAAVTRTLQARPTGSSKGSQRRGRPGGAAPRGGSHPQGERDRPRGRHRLPGEARRPGRSGAGAGGDPCARDEESASAPRTSSSRATGSGTRSPSGSRSSSTSSREPRAPERPCPSCPRSRRSAPARAVADRAEARRGDHLRPPLDEAGASGPCRPRSGASASPTCAAGASTWSSPSTAGGTSSCTCG